MVVEVLVMENNLAIKHADSSNWLYTNMGEKRGYIQPKSLNELWFNTGTKCNLRCPNCFEGSSPTSNRLEQLTLDDVKPFIDDAVNMGCRQFSFTGGEPFFNSNIFDILGYALDFNPCLVLTNGTSPLLNNIEKVRELKQKKYALSFRVSIDYPNPIKHDNNRGEGNFNVSLATLSELYKAGFNVSVARLKTRDEDSEQIENMYKAYFKIINIPEDTRIVAFSDLHLPSSNLNTVEITEHCMTAYKTEETRDRFMCNFSKMIVKKNGKADVFSCTLVDDDDNYNMGSNLSHAMNERVMLKHHRCYSCFASDTSCSEL